MFELPVVILADLNRESRDKIRISRTSNRKTNGERKRERERGIERGGETLGFVIC